MPSGATDEEMEEGGVRADRDREQGPVEEQTEKPVPEAAEPQAVPADGSGKAESPGEPVPTQEQEQEQRPARAAAEDTDASPPPGSTVEVVWIWQETRDCLWRLAKKHYGDPWQWKKIYLANRNAILDPNVIFPKQRIFIPPLARTAE